METRAMIHFQIWSRHVYIIPSHYSYRQCELIPSYACKYVENKLISIWFQVTKKKSIFREQKNNSAAWCLHTSTRYFRSLQTVCSLSNPFNRILLVTHLQVHLCAFIEVKISLHTNSVIGRKQSEPLMGLSLSYLFASLIFSLCVVLIPFIIATGFFLLLIVPTWLQCILLLVYLSAIKTTSYDDRSIYLYNAHQHIPRILCIKIHNSHF